jgi:HSP20 family protein
MTRLLATFFLGTPAVESRGCGNFLGGSASFRRLCEVFVETRRVRSVAERASLYACTVNRATKDSAPSADFFDPPPHGSRHRRAAFAAGSSDSAHAAMRYVACVVLLRQFRRFAGENVMSKKELDVARRAPARDAVSLFKDMTADLDRWFDDAVWPSLRWPLLRRRALEEMSFTPAIDVFERENRLVTRVDLPGLKKEDVKVEVTDGYLTISGERKNEVEEKKDDFYRCERAYGSFSRTVPLPEGVSLEDVKATITEGVLEVSIPLPAQTTKNVRTVDIHEPAKPTKAA